jgi:8-oxo-dGTP diphosphatase
MRSAYARCKIVTNQSELAGGPTMSQQGDTVSGARVPAVVVVVDVANVMGSRADGWWRDRAGAALRLCEQVIALAGRGVPAAAMPAGRPAPGGWVLVLEGRAKDAAGACGAAAAGADGVRVVAAPGSGDDTIVSEVVSLGGACLVVTADRELRRRCEAAGAAVTGPGWLLGLL